MSLAGLAYFVVETRDLERWRAFARDVVGYAVTERPDATLWLRLDERPFRVIVRSGDTDRFVSAGWEFRTQAAYAECLVRVRGAGIEVVEATAGEANARLVRALAHVRDPAGNRLELHWGRTLGVEVFASPAGVSGFVTEPMDAGHVVLAAPNVDACMDFYRDIIGFGLTDSMSFRFGPQAPEQHIHFLHADGPRHHSLALFETPMPPSGLVHAMHEVRTVDDVGRMLDRFERAGYPLMSGLGRHSNDLMLSFYAMTPSGFHLEIGCDGMQIPDWSKWAPTHTLGPDLWGHKWLGPVPTAV